MPSTQRLLERLELILETLACMPMQQRTRPNTNRALAARGQDLLDDTELTALARLGHPLLAH